MPGLALGFDGAGYVKQTGSSVTAVKAGDMVAFAAPGAVCTLGRVKGDLVHVLPKGMSLEDGASIPLVFMAAYQSLMETARLLLGERILIHSAAGGMLIDPIILYHKTDNFRTRSGDDSDCSTRWCGDICHGQHDR